MIPFPYHKSKEARRNLAIIGSQCIPFLVPMLTMGFSWEYALALLFSGIIGGSCIADGDMKIKKNLYTPKRVPVGRNRDKAISNVAMDIAFKEAIADALPEPSKAVDNAFSRLVKSGVDQIITHQKRDNPIVNILDKFL
ncbi:MAG: hypothetical protein DCE90_14010 [Pseudanabaena sp.]|nr:MAG: hypothetical protein DCE90_14010 [Pseudanabaena sp.]